MLCVKWLHIFSVRDFLFSSVIITARRRSCGKVMFSLVSVCLFTGEVPVWPLPMTHWTSTPFPQKSGLEYPCLTPAIDFWWSSLETCSNLFIWGTLLGVTSGCSYWSTYIRTSGWYASCWNTFFLNYVDIAVINALLFYTRFVTNINRL